MIPDTFTNLGLSLHMQIIPAITGSLVLLTVVLAVAYWFLDWDGLMLGSVMSGVFGFLALIVLAVVAIPYQPHYWHDYAVSGTVESVSNTWTDGTGEVTGVPVVQLDTVDMPVAIRDYRAVTLQGADVDLVCQIQWVHRAADRYSCRIAAIAEGRP